MSLGYYFDLWKEGNIVETVEDWFLLSFAYKRLGEKKTRGHYLCDYPLYKSNKKNDKSLILDLWKVLDEADIVIAHNGDRFDLRKTNARFIAHGLKPPSPYKSIDTLKIARKYFKFDSNRLDDLGAYLGVGRKVVHTGKHLWLGCMNGDQKSWAVMKKYNPGDVDLLERVYLLLRPWHATHPNISDDYSNGKCPSCARAHVTKQGPKTTKAGKKQQFKCNDCGHWWTDTKVMKVAA